MEKFVFDNKTIKKKAIVEKRENADYQYFPLF